MNPSHSTPQSYFDGLYAHRDDPWDYAGSWYERRKYGVLLASLPRPRYRVGFEPACSVGELTALLAPRCDALYAVDRAARAAELAAIRVPAAHVACGDGRRVGPAEPCDLLVLSEFLYYFDAAELPSALGDLLAHAAPGADVVACHWRGHSADHAVHGDDVHEVLRTRPELRPLCRHTEEGFVLEVFRLDRPPPKERPCTTR